MVEEITQQNFIEKIIDSGTPSVIDFYAEWCSPCKLVSKTLEKLSSEYDGRVKFYKVSVTKNATLAADLKISETPSVFFFKDSNNIELQKGVIKERELREKIEALSGA